MPDFATRISVGEAQARVVELGRLRALAAETLPLGATAGRYACENILAPHDLPPFANSAMDGFAVRAGDLDSVAPTRLQFAGTVLAGAPSAPECARGQCIRVTTGAPIPGSADSVVIKERAQVEGDIVVVDPLDRIGANVRPAGEDFRRGDVAVRRGDVLTAARLGVLAACGRSHVQVARLPRIAVFVTGDELVAPDRALGYGQIHDSNRFMLGALLGELGIVPKRIAHVRDDPPLLRAALDKAASECDVIISSGGVSAGEADFLPGLVRELGRVHFWKVRMRPGMPMLCGEIGDALVFALPGNPVSTFATFLAFVVPALHALQGAAEPLPKRRKARLAEAIEKSHDRTEFLRASVEWKDDGALWATPLAKQGSGMLRGIVDADALIVVDEATRELRPGEVVDLIALSPRAQGRW